MRRRVVWTDSARNDAREIVRWIAGDSPTAARRIRERLNRAGADLGDIPTGRRGRISGVYEKVVPGTPYVMAYRLDEAAGAVFVLRLIHGARDWRPGGWPKD